MDFEKICMVFQMQEPFYGILLSSMRKTPVPSYVCKTIAVAKTGNTFELIYNPDFIGRFNLDTVLMLLKHECMHLAFNHFTMWDDDETAPPEERYVRNVSEDLEINCYLDRNKMQKEAGGVWCEDLGFDKMLGTREYYKLVKKDIEDKKQQQQANAQNPKQPCNGGGGGGQTKQNKNENIQNKKGDQDDMAGGSSQDTGNASGQTNPLGAEVPNNALSGNSQNSGSGESDVNLEGLYSERFDDHSKWPTDISEAEREVLRQAIDDLLDFAAEETEKHCGTIPGEMVGRIEKIRKKPKPVADWRRYFRRYLGNEFTDLLRKSRKRESTRFPEAPGNRHQRKSNILVAIDTSGSISMPEYKEFFGQIKTLKEKASFHVLECDTDIKYEYDFNGKENLVLHGGGGTSFQPPVDYFLKNRRKYDALVYFTDGGADIPANTPKETLWVISSRGIQDRARYRVNGASVVFIKQNQ